MISQVPQTYVTFPDRTGDDCDLKYGYPLSVDRRIVNNGDGTATDLLTGLQWVRQPELIIPAAGVHTSNQIQVARGAYAAGTTYAKADLVSYSGAYYVSLVNSNTGNTPSSSPSQWVATVWTASAANLTTPAASTWANAVDKCRSLTYAGFSDWRLPNIDELFTLATRYPYPTIGGNILGGGHSENPTGGGMFQDNMTWTASTSTCYYWTSTTLSFNGGRCHIMTFYNHQYTDAAKTDAIYYARPVRGGFKNG